MILVIDNYDSFTYNLVQYIGELGYDPHVVRNDATTVEAIVKAKPGAIVISPGPGTPKDAGISCAVIERFAQHVPILGVCLGHQCIGEVFGARVVRAKEPMHGKTSQVYHDGTGLFEGIDSPFTATRYHSLVLEPSSLPPSLEVTARTEDGTIMGVRHRSANVEGVQFHPESILTVGGKQLLSNFLKRIEPAIVGQEETHHAT